MKQKLLSIALALLPLAVWAQIQTDGRFLQDGIYYRLNNETMTASVTRQSRVGSAQYTGDVVIPETITTEEGKTYAVDEIEDQAFTSSRITSFTCGENIKKLGNYVFRYSKFLKSATIHGLPQHEVLCTYTLGAMSQARWRGIGQDMFDGCSALESVTCGPLIQVIGDEAFYNNKTLKEVHLQDGIIHIGQRAFENCTALTKVEIPSSIIFIGNNAFARSGLTSISIHPAAKDWGEGDTAALAWWGYAEHYAGDPAYCHLGWEVFKDCASLAEVSLGEQVSMRGRCFKGTAWEAAQPDGVLYVGDMTVGYKGEAQPTVAIKEGTKRITGEPFWDAYVDPRNIPVEVTLPQSLKIIDDFTFDRLKVGNLTIPKNVTWVGPSALYACDAERIFLEPVTPPACNGLYQDPNSFGMDCHPRGSIFVPSASLEAYCQSPWSDDYRVTILPYDGFDAATGAVFTVNEEQKTAAITSMLGTDLVVPSTVSCNGESYTVTELVTGSITAWGKLTLPQTLTTIRSAAIGFPQEANGAEWVPGSVHIPASVTCVEQRAIIYASTITVDAANTTYDSREDCNAIIETATNTLLLAGTDNPRIPASVTAIGDFAFAGNKHLKGLVLPQGLTSVGALAFAACDSITSLHIPASLTGIGQGAFSGCKWLTGITVAPENPVYESIDGFQAIIERETKTLVQGCAIQPYTGENETIRYRRTLVVPDGIRRIGDMAYGMAAGMDYDVNYPSAMLLKTIVLPPSCVSVGAEAFTACIDLRELVVRTKERLRAEYAMPEGFIPWRLSDIFSQPSNITIKVPAGTLARCYANEEFNEYGKMMEGYGNESFTFNDADMTATIILPVPLDEEACLKIPATASGYYEGENYTVTAVGDGGTTTPGFNRTLDRSVKKVELPATITRINANAFSSCKELTSINLPEGLEYIGASAFSGDSVLAITALPQSVAYVGSSAFRGMPITLEEEDGISYFGSIAYSNSRQTVQDTIAFREGTMVVAEGQYSFSGSQARRRKFNITLPKSMKTLCERAFSVSVGAGIQANITSFAEVPPTVWKESGQLSNNFAIDTLYIPAGCREAYLTQGRFDDNGNFISPWAAKTIIEMGGYQTDEGIHYALNADGTATLTAVDTSYHAALVIPETLTVEGKTYTVTAIGAYALDSCSVASVSIPATVEHVGQGAFQGSSIDVVALPEKQTEVAPLAFAGSDIQSIILPAAITSIGNGAFRDCANLRYVILPDSVKSIGDYAFAGMGVNTLAEASAVPRRQAPVVNPDDDLLRGKTFVTLPAGITAIGARAFDGVEVIESFLRNPQQVQMPYDALSSNLVVRIPFGLSEDYRQTRFYWTTLIERAAEQFALTYVVDGEVYQQVMVTEGSIIEELVVPAERENYTFFGWTLADGSEWQLPGQMPYGGLTLYGNYVLNDDISAPADRRAPVVGIYGPDGRHLDAPVRGLNILRMSDGTARKLIRE